MAKLSPSKFLSVVPKILLSKTAPKPQLCAKESGLARIPDDILFLVYNYLDVADKSSLLQTCRYLHRMLEPALYRNLNLTDPIVTYRSDRAHRTLMERQDLLPYILSYCGPLFPRTFQPVGSRNPISKLVRWSKGKLSDGEHIPWTESQTFKAAIIIFTKAVNIRDLQFTDFTDWTFDPTWEPVKTAVFNMKLTRLVLRVSGDSTNAVQVLQAQPELDHLELGWGTTELEKLKATDLPKLTSLTATLLEAEAIVPGRPVRKLHLLGTLGDHAGAEKRFSRLPQSSGPVSTFSMRFYLPGDVENMLPTFQMIAHHLPSIEDLTIFIGGVVSAQALLDAIPSFRSLRRLALLFADLAYPTDTPGKPPVASTASSTHNDTITHAPLVNSWDSLIRRLKAQCPSLVDVRYTPVPSLHICCCAY